MQDKFNMSRELSVALAKRNVIDSIWKSARLEGLDITFPQTDCICEGYAPEGTSIQSILVINNLKHAWQFIFDTLDYEFDYPYLSQLNQLVSQGITHRAGVIRSADVQIGGTTWKPKIPHLENVKEDLQNILTSQNSITERAIDLMLYCMRSHIFLDGNKRTAMLAANQYLIQNGKGTIAIPEALLQEFKVHLITFYETNDSSAIKQFIWEKCLVGSQEPAVRQTEEPLGTEYFIKKSRENAKKKGICSICGGEIEQCNHMQFLS